MPRKILRAVLFDLGSTLMYERQSSPSINAHADEALTLYLREQGLELNLSSFPVEFRRRLDEYFKKREKDLHETTYAFVLRDILNDKGYGDVSDDILRNALDRLFAITQTNWELEADALPTLKKLEGDGYRLGVISNAGDDRDVQQLVKKFGIASHFDFVLTSAACGYRKPHSFIFEIALSKWNFPAAEVAMVGDNLDADIRGAKQAGLYGIWISRRAGPGTPHQFPVEPDASIASLTELPPILDRLQVQ